MANYRRTQAGGKRLTQAGGGRLLQLSDVPVSRRWVCRPVKTAWRVAAAVLVWRADPVAEFVDNILVKTPGDSGFRYAMDLRDVLRALGSGVTVTGAGSVAVSPAGPILSGLQIDTGAGSVSVLIAGGTDGTDYLVKFSGVTLSGGQTVERTGTLRVRSQ